MSMWALDAQEYILFWNNLLNHFSFAVAGKYFSTIVFSVCLSHCRFFIWFNSLIKQMSIETSNFILLNVIIELICFIQLLVGLVQ